MELNIRMVAYAASLAASIVALTACSSSGNRQADGAASPASTTNMAPARPAGGAPAAAAPAAAPAPMVSYAMAAPMTGRKVATVAQPRPVAQAQQLNRERYEKIQDNPVKLTAKDSVSTLSLDVDTGSYANVRRFLKQGKLPPKDAVRVEELINYFPYAYANQPEGAAPFTVSTEAAPAPWNPQHVLLRVGVKAVERQAQSMPAANLVLLVDVSGSMNARDKLPLVKATIRQLVEQLREQDRVSLVTYSGRTELMLEPTNDKQKILAAMEKLYASGSTAGGDALAIAYQQARTSFIRGGINRILMATDGDFNVGVADVAQLKSMVERERSSGISLTTLGFGQDNFNEPLMQQLAQVGNGSYSYIDSAQEARKVLVEELSSTFNTVAADVKLQVEFNPATVQEWRLIGYENRLLDEADFRNDKVDAVEIGAGKSVTALYELTPVGQAALHVPRRYGQQAASNGARGKANEYGELRIRYKQPGESKASEMQQLIGTRLATPPSTDWQFAAAVAGFGQLLRGGTYTGNWGYDQASTLAQGARGQDPHGYRAELVQLLELARGITPRAPQP